MTIWIGAFVLGVLPLGLVSIDVRAADDSNWRTLPLIRDGQLDPSWTHTGWGKFVVADGASGGWVYRAAES